MSYYYVLFYLFFINLLAYVLMYIDKRAAVRGRRRIPEASFYTIGLLLGAMGLLLGSRAFRHKTRKQPFRTWMWVLLFGNIGVFYFLIF